MSLIIPANTLASGGYAVDNSCRFETNTYMTKTAASGNTRTSTVSFWCKRAFLGAVPSGSNQFPISFYQNSTNRISVAFLTNNTMIVFGEVGGVTKMNLTTNRVFKDTSAWYHVVIKIDTTQGTASNRLKLYINGVQETSFSTETYPNENQELIINTNIYIGVYDTTNNFFHGYMAEFVYIDGTAYEPTSFGEFDSDSGIWKPIDVSGLTFGTNGFYLDFKDSANLGNDANGGTDLTEYNLTAIDQTTDTCTNNFATLNSLNSWGDTVLTNGNTTAGNTGTSAGHVSSTIHMNSGKWYMEFNVDTHLTSYSAPVFLLAGTGAFQQAQVGFNSSGDGSFGIASNGRSVTDGADSGSVVIPALVNNDKVQIAYDADAGKAWFGINGAYLDSGNPTTAANPYFTSTKLQNNDVSLIILGYNGNAMSANFGSPPYSESGGETDGNGYGNFAHAVPTNYYSLNTKNLAEYG